LLASHPPRQAPQRAHRPPPPDARRSHQQTLRVVWQVDFEPGLIFVPNRSSEPVISSAVINMQAVNTVTVDPSDFSGILGLLQTRIVGFLAASGPLGYL